MSDKPLAKGDYVLATKYRDGDPGDQFAIGFYDREFQDAGGVRHFVVDGKGNQFRANGFRRVKKISSARGRWLVENQREIELSGRSLWGWLRRPMSAQP